MYFFLSIALLTPVVTTRDVESESESESVGIGNLAGIGIGIGKKNYRF